jgi:hypothetical protein
MKLVRLIKRCLNETYSKASWHRNLYFSTSTIRLIKSMKARWEGHVARTREERNAYKLLMGEPEGKRPLGRSRLGGWMILS